MYRIEDITNVHLELTSNCNASCPRCQRNFHGFPYNRGYKVTELTLKDIETIFPKEFVQQLQTIDFNGNFGDFLLAKENLEILAYFRSIKADDLVFNIHTNGSARTKQFWQQLAEYKPTVFFDLDGLADTHSRYRIGTNFDTIIANAKTFIEAGGEAFWKMIPFDYNKHQIETCKQMANDLGFKKFILFDQGRNTGPVYDRKGQYQYDLDSIVKNPKFLNVEQHLEQWKKDSIADVYYTDVFEIQCEAQRKYSIYISAEGEVYPCCFLGFSPRTFQGQIGNKQIKSILENFNNNALELPIKDCIEWFNLVEKSWSIPNFDQGRLFICNRVCGKMTNNKLVRQHY